MKLFRLALVVVALAAPACHAPTSIQTQAGKTAYTADQVLQRVGEFQTAVIDGQIANKITVSDARALVAWTVDVAQILKATPSGWQVTVTASWNAIRPQAQAIPAIAPYVSTLDLVIATLGGQ